MKSSTLESQALPMLAMAGGLGLFGLFIWLDGHDPVQAWGLLFRGAFGDAFSLQNSLQRAAPLMLTALCVAIPARAGLTVIGGEGAKADGLDAIVALAEKTYGKDVTQKEVGTQLKKHWQIQPPDSCTACHR